MHVHDRQPPEARPIVLCVVQYSDLNALQHPRRVVNADRESRLRAPHAIVGAHGDAGQVHGLRVDARDVEAADLRAVYPVARRGEAEIRRPLTTASPLNATPRISRSATT